MHPLAILLNLAASVMLLLWAVRMVRTGVERAWGTQLRRILRKAQTARLRMASAGCALAVVLQSSTAVAALAAGFAAGGMLPVGAGIAALIGADFGSALVVKVLTFDLSWLLPVLVLVGTTLFLKFDGRLVRYAGRVILGIGFVLMSLQMLGHSTEPLRHSEALPAVVAYLSSDPITAFLVAGLLTWALHSSVGTLLLLVTLAQRGLLPIEAAVPMVLGVNLGAGLIAVWLTRSMPREARLIPMANLLARAAAALIALGLVIVLRPPMDFLGPEPGTQLVHLHLLFNGVMVLVVLPVLGPLESLARLVVRDPDAGKVEPQQKSALDPTTMSVPSLALGSARRELLRMGETVAQMLSPIADILEEYRPEIATRIRQQETETDTSHSEIKLFLAELARKGLSESDARRAAELTGFAINLEHAGDLIAKSLLGLAEKKASRGLKFSEEGWSEIEALHGRVMTNLEMALNVLVSGDVDSARALAREKEIMRDLERTSHQKHLARLQSGKIESIETSGLHLEAVRALKEINSAVVTVAYPILAETGQLLQSRLAAKA